MFTRRTLLLTSAAVALSSLSGPSRSQPSVRYNAASPQGKAMLRIYADAVRAMKALSGTDAKSWTFQWYIHATPQPKAQLINTVFGTGPSSGRDLANETWYTCQSHSGQPEDYFLPWHRLYVLHFEQIIRAVTGHPEFTLPYWDYTSAASYAIPDEFQAKNQNDPVFSSLFVANRNKDGGGLKSADVNAGEPLNKHFPGARNFLVLPDLTEPDYSSFCSQLDGNLHGNIHVYTGDGTNMGKVPTAAGDPVFWLHHCNIDRIWSSWNASRGQNPTQTNGVDWAKTNFVFADRNGNRFETAISTVSDSSALPYSYDTMAGQVVAQAGGSRPERHVLLKSIAPGAVAAPAEATPPSAVPLGGTPRTVRLAPTTPQNRLMAIAPHIPSGSPSRFFLTLKDVQARTNPNTTYEVFLDLPPNASPDAADEHYVGLLNFFGAIMDPTHDHRGGRTIEFDVTRVVLRLTASNKLQNETTVTLVPVGQPADDSAPVVAGGIELHQR